MNQLLHSIKTQSFRIIMILVIFLIFLSNYIGLFEISLLAGPRFSTHLNLFELEALLSNRHIINLEFYIYICLGIVLCILLPIISPLKALILTGSSIAVPIVINSQFGSPGTLLPVEYSILTILILYIMNVLLHYFTEVHSKQKILDVFQHYVPPQVVNEIAKNPDQFTLSGEAKELTVLFCDIKNFTSISEHMTPRQITSMLNEYFTTMSEILYDYGATIDKYIGDAIMAFWGAPLACEDHAQRGILAVMEMNRSIETLSRKFTNDIHEIPEAGFGLNTGIMNVGNMGSRYRVSYTVIGDAVNLASRIEKLTRFYRVPIIVSESTRNQTSGIIYRELDQVQVRGKTTFTRLFQPLKPENEMTDELNSLLDLQKEGLQYFYKKRWDNAEHVFKELKTKNKDDDYYDVMLDLIKLRPE